MLGTLKAKILKALVKNIELPFEQFEGSTCLRGDSLVIHTGNQGIVQIELKRFGESIYILPIRNHRYKDTLELGGVHTFMEFNLLD
jgi:hypothetical protein